MESRFTGNIVGFFGLKVAQYLLTVFTLGLGGPWAICLRERWMVKHTYIDGYRLIFDGKGRELFGKYLTWYLLSIITCGIYSFWFNINLKKWITKHTHMVVNVDPLDVANVALVIE